MNKEQSVISIPVTEVEHILKHIRKNYRNIEGPQLNVPAHITLQFPWIEPHLITDDILKELGDLLVDVASFEYKLKIS